MTTARLVPCPTCSRNTEFTPANPWRPFCSERCKMIDLGQWASETYRIPDPGPVDPEELDDTPLQ